ncbi:phage antirepressor N-terminal domain-containing protein [Spongiibacter taiwanensis]|uniref:phage antirepressor N-terminal domain-containing protein n=1 Tax=Spongiibacter taiwanensis TaxID=1748242 RepID=UPI002035F292|nr:phage antirepressor N-terminal domain-containing protein [Spongiibacter taiwanensis]USA43349.1 phage antirepressor N-terminal domain-containing protein [Spongiibacter taiwanensis]
MSNATRVVNLINFHGVTMIVVEHEGVQYIPFKPLVDLSETDWRNAKKAAFSVDNAILFGSKLLKDPIFAAEGGDITPQKESIYIRLDRSRMFLARIQTSRVRAQGNEEAAEKLLKLQIEWAQALHSYETNGVAYKRGKGEAVSQLDKLIRSRNATNDAKEKQSISLLIRDHLNEMGAAVDDDMPLFQ